MRQHGQGVFRSSGGDGMSSSWRRTRTCWPGRSRVPGSPGAGGYGVCSSVPRPSNVERAGDVVEFGRPALVGQVPRSGVRGRLRAVSRPPAANTLRGRTTRPSSACQVERRCPSTTANIAPSSAQPMFCNVSAVARCFFRLRPSSIAAADIWPHHAAHRVRGAGELLLHYVR